MSGQSHPVGWCQAQLGNVISGFQAGRNLKALGRPAANDELGVIKISAVTWGAFRAAENKALLPGDEPKPHEVIRAGDLLITRANTTELVGAVVLVERDFPNLMLPDKVLRLLTIHDVVDSRFLMFALRTSDARRHFEINATGTSDSMRNLSQPKMAAVPLLLPPRPEQRRIVAKIEALQARSRAAREALDAIPPLLDRFRQSVLAAAFRGDLTADWRANHPDVEPASVLLDRIRLERRHRWEQAHLAKLKAKGPPPNDTTWKTKYQDPAPVDTSGLPELPKGWCWASVDELLREGPSNGYSPKSGDDAKGAQTLKLSATTQGRCVLSSMTTKRVYEEIPPASPYWLVPGDLLVQRANTLEYVGTAAMFDGPSRTFIYPDLMMRLRCVSGFETAWLWRVFAWHVSRAHLQSKATGTAGNMPKVNGHTVRTMPVPVPPLAEQRLLIRLIAQAESFGDSVSKAVGTGAMNTERLNQAILAKAFRGELVPQDPNDEPAAVLLERIRAERGAVASKKTQRGRAKKTARKAPAPANEEPAPVRTPPAAVLTHSQPRQAPDFTALDHDERIDLVFAALLGAGSLELDAAVRHAADHLRATGSTDFRRLRKDGPLYTAIADVIQRGARRGTFDRPRRGHLRAILPDPKSYRRDHWRTCLLAALDSLASDASADGAAIPRDQALRAAAHWAADHMGLTFTRLPPDGLILTALKSALTAAIRAGEVERLGPSHVRRHSDER